MGNRTRRDVLAAGAAAPRRPGAPLRSLRQSRSCRAAVHGDFSGVDFCGEVCAGGEAAYEASQ